MPTLGSDLTHAKTCVDRAGRVFCAGWASGSVYVEMSAKANLECETLTSNHQKFVCAAAEHQPGIVVPPDGSVLVTVEGAAGLETWRIASWSASPERVASL